MDGMDVLPLKSKRLSNGAAVEVVTDGLFKTMRLKGSEGQFYTNIMPLAEWMIGEAAPEDAVYVAHGGRPGGEFDFLDSSGELVMGGRFTPAGVYERLQRETDMSRWRRNAQAIDRAVAMFETTPEAAEFRATQAFAVGVLLPNTEPDRLHVLKSPNLIMQVLSFLHQNRDSDTAPYNLPRIGDALAWQKGAAYDSKIHGDLRHLAAGGVLVRDWLTKNPPEAPERLEYGLGEEAPRDFFSAGNYKGSIGKVRFGSRLTWAPKMPLVRRS